MVWVVVNEKFATLEEIETHWSLDDLMRCLAFIEIKADIDYQNRKEQNAKK